MKYPYDWDIEWLAVDAEGNVGVFTTGGKGPLPRKGFEEYSSEDFSETLWSLPKISGSVLLVDLPRPDDYIELAEKGFYTYDWCDVHRTKEKLNKYEIQTKPTCPIKLNDLPKMIRNVIGEMAMPVKFEEIREVDVCAYIECVDDA